MPSSRSAVFHRRSDIATWASAVWPNVSQVRSPQALARVDQLTGARRRLVDAAGLELEPRHAPGQRHPRDPIHQHALAVQPRIDRGEGDPRAFEIAQPEMREAQDDLPHHLAERVAGLARLRDRQLAEHPRLLELARFLVQPRQLEPEKQRQPTMPVLFGRP